MKKKVFVVGASGALGNIALQVISDHSDLFEPIGITGYENVNTILDQCASFNPLYIGIKKEFCGLIKDKCPNKYVFDVEKELTDVLIEFSPDMTLFLSSGIGAIRPVVSLLRSGKTVGIANKESIIAGGKVIFRKDSPGFIVPIDSEPSAIFQALLGEDKNAVRSIIITASGGPFWNRDKDELKYVLPKDALKHPNWKMGKKITIDSATMANKAFEVIEAHFLFGMPYNKIKAIVHRESIIHSLVEFEDGNIKAVLSPTSMYYPIQFALTYPNRLNSAPGYLSLPEIGKLSFYEMNCIKFPAFCEILQIAKEDENFLPAVVAADETAVKAFLSDKIRFTDIHRIIIETVSKINSADATSINGIEQLYKDAIITANNIIRRRTI